MWLERLGGAESACITGRRFLRNFIEFSVEGPQLDPGSGQNEAKFVLTSRLLADSGLALSYSYRNGRNCLTLNLPKKIKLGQVSRLVISIAAASVIGLTVRTTAPDLRQVLLSVTQPLYGTLISFLCAAASPFIFFSICNSIVGMGDINQFERIGKRLIVNMISGVFLFTSGTAILLSFFLHIEGRSELSSDGIFEIYKLILGIVPTDIITPFQTGNIIQIIFLAIVSAVAMLILGGKVAGIRQDLDQLSKAMLFIISFIARTLPLFVFLGVLNLLLLEIDFNGKIFIKVITVTALVFYVILSAHIFKAALRFKIKPWKLIKKLLPAHLIGLATASSTAAFAVTLDSTKKELGVKEKTADFAIPLGTVIYKPLLAVEYLILSFAMAVVYDLNISYNWLITAVFITSLCAVSMPPVAGCDLSSIAIIFPTLGIPQEAIGISVVITTILDFPVAACGISCVQTMLLLTADKLGLVDREICYDCNRRSGQ
ncbi:MAG: cation:dicarboxylase symporter family transporter [Synergistes sp.]|nr:cation:dicarboxylase symporter family transporter [Synergistes sp.]